MKKEKNGLLWLLFCIPIPVIIYLGIMFSQNEISPDEIKSVTVTDINGLQGQYEDAGSIDFFVNMILNAEKVDGAWRDFSEEKPIELTFERKNGSVFRHYVYAELDYSGCFVVDKDNNVKRLSASDAEKLLMRLEWQYLYQPRMLPKLSVSPVDSEDEGDAVLPKDYKWKYQKSNGTFASDTESKVADGEKPIVYIKAEHKYEFSFSETPDKVRTEIYNGDIMLEDNSLQSLIFNSDTELLVKLSAEWTQKENSVFYGEAEWEFTLVYDISPNVVMDEKTLSPGSVGVVKFYDLSEGETVEMETDLPTSQFNACKGEDCKFAFIPIAADASAGEYSLKFTIGDDVYDYKVTVVDNSYSAAHVKVDPERLNESLKPDNAAALSKLINELTENSAKGALYDSSAFLSPMTASSGATTAENPPLTYGMSVIYNDSEPPYVVYKGNDIRSEEGAVVLASQRGKVVFRGETAETGKTLIIDHGNGILTYYCHLSDYTAGMDKIVQKGEIIGNAGSTGLVETPKLRFSVTVNGIFVDPEPLMKSGAPKN